LAGWPFATYLYFYVNSSYTTVKFQRWYYSGSFAPTNKLKASLWTSAWYASLTSNLYTDYFSFTSGAMTAKIKNRAFGQLTTDDGVHISWQRAKNWPTNPVVPSYAITASMGANGTISPSGSQVVNQGGSRLFTITPNPGYVISDVLVDGGSVGPVPLYNFALVAANHTISATFAVDPVPQMLLTISGLPVGQTICGGLWNGVHAVSPLAYQLLPYEVWFWTTTGGAKLSLEAYPNTTTTSLGTSRAVLALPLFGGGTATMQAHFNFLSSIVAPTTQISYLSFPFTVGTVTTKIKNRTFGTITTTSGVTISWQRAPNWPSNP